MAEFELVLDVKCSQCHGTGEGYISRCGYCGGKGYLPTKDGRASLDFIERHQSRDGDDW